MPGEIHPFRVARQGTSDFESALATLHRRGEADFSQVEAAVREILASVRREGDRAVLRFDEQFGGRRAPRRLVRQDYGGADALARLAPELREALVLAADRIRAFHERQREHGFRFDAEGISLGIRVRPMSRVGVYAPGGKARYPSSVLMAGIPAHVAGVRDIALATPLAGDGSDDAIFAAAHLAGITSIVDAGGAQAIAALAYGTESVPKVDKIVGPGNAYVACAKRLVFGAVDVDCVAGPSEILVLADDEADPRLVAADLLSQAEHDEAAYAVLVCTSDLMAQAVSRELAAQLEVLPRRAIAEISLRVNGCALVVETVEEMTAVADSIAPEHLSLHVTDPEAIFERVRHVGAVFLGSSTPEAAGDYLAGPSHVLPTGSAVRFGGPLGVNDFLARTSIIRYSKDALDRQGKAIMILARLEGLEGHARAVEVRLSGVRGG